MRVWALETFLLESHLPRIGVGHRVQGVVKAVAGRHGTGTTCVLGLRGTHFSGRRAEAQMRHR